MIVGLLMVGGSLTTSHAETTMEYEGRLNPGQQRVGLTSLLAISVDETYEIYLYASQPVLFQIMNRSEYDTLQTLPNYTARCVLNITTTHYYNQSFSFPADGDYVYIIFNNGSSYADIKLRITRPGFYINGFSIFWVISSIVFISWGFLLLKMKNKQSGSRAFHA